jgi:UDP-N-acetylglucosamine--N-acetylmuramyl-(pentapeptide) pyrophosphoryl-undecaprenol N-acetylglucosamine transferase
MSKSSPAPLVAIACGGTGGHLFPGLAVGEELLALGCDVMLLVSPKDVDQQAVRAVTDMQVVTLPAVGLVRGNLLGFFKGFRESKREAIRVFEKRPPAAVLAMGGFTSAPPIFAGRKFKAATFLHESNTIPGRANRLLSRFVSEAFIGFASAAKRLHTRDVRVTGTPVRPQFTRADAASARVALGLDPNRETLLVMGGSQGASAINQLLMRCLSDLRRELPNLQFLHLTGARDYEKVVAAYEQERGPSRPRESTESSKRADETVRSPLRFVVRPFLTEMELALNAATVAVSRSGASSLAESAAMRLPAILIPFPAATDNHQFHNARAFVEKGAARMLGEQRATPENLTSLVQELITNVAERRRIISALAEWHFPNAAAEIADSIVKRIPNGAMLTRQVIRPSDDRNESLKVNLELEPCLKP